MNLNLKLIHQQVLPLVKHINQLLVKNFSLPKKISYKVGSQASTSIVTQLDGQIEKYLKKELKKIFPQAGFIGEETGSNVKEYNWIIDPIDGTFNFAQQIPTFAVSIGLWHQNQPIYGIVSFPITNEIIHAFDQPGIFLNQKLTQIKIKKIKKPLAVFSVVSGDPSMGKIYHQINSIISSPRSYGCCVLHGAYTALNRIHVAVIINQAIWDIGAIVPMVKAAGLSVHWLTPKPDLSKATVNDYQHSLIIGQPDLVTDLSSKIKL